MPGNICSYHMCENNTRNVDKSVHFHRFPVNDGIRCKEWLMNCGNPVLPFLAAEKLRSRYICSTHFENHCFVSSERLKLRKDATPIVYNDEDSCFKIEDESLDETNDLKLNTGTSTYEKLSDILGPYSPPNLTEENTFLTVNSVENINLLHVTPSAIKHEFDDRTPEQKKIALYFNKRRKRKIQNLINHRLRMQLKAKKRIKQNLKIYNRIKSLPINSRSIINMQLKGLKKIKKWNKAEKKLAISIFLNSPSCYTFMRNIQISLPSERTVRRWIDSSQQSLDIKHTLIDQVKIETDVEDSLSTARCEDSESKDAPTISIQVKVEP